MKKPILILPCSGIGKPFGSIARDATFRVCDELRLGKADTLCLSLLVMGDEEARNRVASSQCIVVDGCPMACSRNNVDRSAGNIVTEFKVMDLLRENRGFKPREVTFLDEDGEKLSKILADKIAAKIDELMEESE
ncbi:MAG: putative zinc-binding protein [Candidatus Bathyarchaeia archaeon]